MDAPDGAVPNAADMKTLQVATRIHGRVLVREAADPTAVIFGFHGYMENADIQMRRLVEMAGPAPWTLVSVQGLHRFYRARSEAVIASWMTSQDRDDMIADNVEYVDRVAEVSAPPGVPLITAGFSQGAATAFRSAVRGKRRAAGIIAVGGDVPPELLPDRSLTFPPTLLVRGDRDEWYTAAKLDADLTRLRGRGAAAEPLIFGTGHEWTVEISGAASRFVERLARS